MVSKLVQGLHYAFFDLLGGIGVWLLVGIILAGAITAFMPPAFIERYLGSGLQSMVMMLVIAVPLYVCATGSTPIAAALALKGLSPGAALVFLLAGPATNAASLLVVAKILGKRATVIYLTVIVVISLVLGLLTNFIYALLGLDVAQWIQASHGESTGWVDGVLAVVLLLLIGFNLIRVHLFKGASSCGSAAVAIAPIQPTSNK